MSARINKAFVVVAAIAIGLVSPQVGQSQDDVFGPQTPANNVADPWMTGNVERPEPFHFQLRRAISALHDAKVGDQRDDAARRLRSVLERYFDADVKDREKVLADVEARVRRLRAQLDRRREKKQEIIELQLKLAVNEVEGLGFFGQGGGFGQGPMEFRGMMGWEGEGYGGRGGYGGGYGGYGMGRGEMMGGGYGEGEGVDVPGSTVQPQLAPSESTPPTDMADESVAEPAATTAQPAVPSADSNVPGQ